MCHFTNWHTLGRHRCSLRSKLKDMTLAIPRFEPTITRPHPHQSIAHLVLTVAGINGIVGLFLPFTWATSPLEAVFNDPWQIGLPFFLAIPASAASIRWIISGSFSRPERTIAYVVGASMAGVTLYTWFWGIGRELLFGSYGPTTAQEWVQCVLTLMIPPLVLTLGVYFLVRNSRMGFSGGFNPMMAIQLAYIANAMLYLLLFFGGWEPGAYCVLIASLAFVLQIVLVAAQPRQP